MTIRIKAPPRVIRSNPIWQGTSWMTLDINRMDQSVLNNVKIYNQNNGKTSINQLASAKLQVILTGYITDDSELVGSGVTEKTKNLILAGRSWYHGISAGSSDTAQLDINGKYYDTLIQKVAVIDTAELGDVRTDYQIGLILKYEG